MIHGFRHKGLRQFFETGTTAGIHQPALARKLRLQLAALHSAALISEQSYATLQGRQASRRVWAAIADWREAVDPASPSPLEWPLPPGEAGDQEIEGWRDQSAGREVVLG